MGVDPRTQCVSCECSCPTVPSPLAGEGQGEGWRRNTEHEARLTHRLANNMKQRPCVFYPSPCPSPTRGEGTLGHCSAQPQAAFELATKKHKEETPCDQEWFTRSRF